MMESNVLLSGQEHHQFQDRCSTASMLLVLPRLPGIWQFGLTHSAICPMSPLLWRCTSLENIALLSACQKQSPDLPVCSLAACAGPPFLLAVEEHDAQRHPERDQVHADKQAGHTHDQLQQQQQQGQGQGCAGGRDLSSSRGEGGEGGWEIGAGPSSSRATSQSEAASSEGEGQGVPPKKRKMVAL